MVSARCAVSFCFSCMELLVWCVVHGTSQAPALVLYHRQGFPYCTSPVKYKKRMTKKSPLMVCATISSSALRGIGTGDW